MAAGNKQRKKAGKPKKANNLRHAEHCDMQSTFDGLCAKASKGESFDALMDLMFSRDNVLPGHQVFRAFGTG
jgi:hypothetical protein